MDQATLIRARAAKAWEEYAHQGRPLRGERGALPLRAMLSDLAERAFNLTVIEDDTLRGTNIEGEFDRDAGLILLNPGLSSDRSAYVTAHEIGHAALDHPLHRISDTAEQIDPEVTPDDLSADRPQGVTGLDLSDAALTALRGYNPRDTYELQANAFATELLVPGGELRSILQRDPDTELTALALRFGVPVSLARVGLANALFGSRRDLPNQNPAPSPLDDEQRRAADCPAPALVIAGPGAGKTRVLVSRYASLVAEGVPPRQILALTFANKAAGEMRERLSAMVGPEHAASVEVLTFHSYGLSLLQQYGDRIGLKLPLRLVTPMDALLLFRRRAGRMGLGVLEDLTRALEALRKLLSAVARSKEENAGPERWEQLAKSWEEANPGAELPLWAGDGAAFFREYQSTLRRYGLLDYADLQMEAMRLFSIPEVAAEIRARVDHILVDEFQDINFVSGQLVRALDGGRGIVWAVGDPRQSIYGFRGASPVNLTRFRSPECYPEAAIVSLTTNYRSVPDIVDAGMAVPMTLPGDPALTPPRLHAERSRVESAPAVTTARLPNGAEEMRWLAAEARSLKDSGTALSDIAVLTRNNRHAAKVAEAFSAAGIPHRWGGPLHHRPVFRVLASALLIAADQSAGIAGLTALEPLPGIPLDAPLSEADRRLLFADGRGRLPARHLLEMAAAGHVEGLSDSGAESCRSLLRLAESLSPTARPYHNLSVYLLEHADWVRRLLGTELEGTPHAPAALSTIGQVLDLAAAFASQRAALARSSSALNSIEDDDRLDTETTTSAFLAYLQAALQSGDLGTSSELDVEGDAVTIMTAHRSKGLEWPVVFIPFCMEGQFPSKVRDNDLPLPPELIVTDDVDAAETHAREEACLFYVAVTRARNRLFLSSAETYGARTNGPIAALCQAVITALDADGRIHCATPNLPRASPPDIDGDEEAALIPLAIGPTLHEYGLRQYRECPRRYLYQSIYGLGETDTAFPAFHAAVYRAARESGSGPPPLRERFEALWRESGPPAEHWQTPLLRIAADRLIERLGEPAQNGAERRYREEKILQVEADDGNSFDIRLTIDQIDVGQEGRRSFRRHKHGRSLPKSPPDDELVTLYAMVADQEESDTDVAYFYPFVGETMKPTIGKIKKANMRAAILRAIEGIRRGDVRAKPGEACKRCPYALICDRQ